MPYKRKKRKIYKSVRSRDRRDEILFCGILICLVVWILVVAAAPLISFISKLLWAVLLHILYL